MSLFMLSFITDIFLLSSITLFSLSESFDVNSLFIGPRVFVCRRRTRSPCIGACESVLYYRKHIFRKLPHSFIHPSIHPPIHSFVHSLIHSFIHPPIHSFVHSLINSSIHSSTPPPRPLSPLSLHFVRLICIKFVPILFYSFLFNQPSSFHPCVVSGRCFYSICLQLFSSSILERAEDFQRFVQDVCRFVFWNRRAASGLDPTI